MQKALKQLFSKLPLLLFTAFLSFGFSINAFAALNGVYTIHPGSAASATNYKNWKSAVNDLKLGTRTDGGPANGPGISAAVTFNIAAGIYNEQVDIPLVNGVSLTNTITFDGGNALSCIVQANSTPYPNIAVFKFDTCKYVTVKNITINSNVPANVDNSYGVNFVGKFASYCDNNMLKQCIINLLYQPYVSNALSNVNMFGAIFNGDGLTNTTKGYFNNNVIDGCTFNNGYVGIRGIGSSDSSNGNIIRNNVLSNYNSAGIMLNNMNGVKITGNTLASNHSSSKYIYGIYNNAGMVLTSCNASTTDFTDISQNKVNSFYILGIVINSCKGRGNFRNRVSNNFILKGLKPEVNFRRVFCLSIFDSDSIDILNNSLNINYSVTSNVNGNAAAFYEDGNSSSIDIRDNIFSCSGTTGNAFSFSSPGNGSNYLAFDYNIFYNADSSKTGYLNSTVYVTPNVGGTFNTNSFSVNPGFKSATDLHLVNYFSGKQGTVTGITTDIDGETRGTPGLIGADDFPAISNNDLGVSAISAPVSPVGAGLQTITVNISNIGLNTVTTATVHYTLNGSAPVSQAWSGSLSQGATAGFSFTVKGNFVAGLNTLKVYTSLPNGSPDSYAGNDTLTGTFYTTLNGIYTINSSLLASATNFVSFLSAAKGLNGGVVTGPVTINIAPGTYNEQIELKPINGTSLVNTVKFEGKDTAKVTLAWNGADAKQHTINLKGCRYVTFAHIKIKGLNTQYAWPIHFNSDSTNYNRIVGCAISVPSIIDDLNECPVMFGDANAYVPPYTLPLLDVKYNEIDSCVINGGATAVYFSGLALSGIDSINLTGNRFVANTISNYYSWGIGLYGANASKILNNTISPNQATAGGIYVAYTQNSSNDFTDISGNVISHFGYHLFAYSGIIQGGIELSTCSGNHAGNIRISNNMVGGGLRANSNCLYMVACSKVDVVFNTFNNDREQTPGANFAAVIDNSGGPITFMNNIFAVTAESGLATSFFEVNDTSKFTPSTFDYNIFYNSANKNAAFVGGVMYTQANVVGGGSFNTHSYTMNPLFKSPVNLHISAQSQIGNAFVGITTDIDGQTRSNKPNIGADEINLNCVPPSVSQLISGDTIVCQGQTNVTYLLAPVSGAANYVWSVPGGATITSGSTSNSVTLNFSNSALDGALSVYATNTCGNGSISLPLQVAVNTPPILGISTQAIKCNGECNGLVSVYPQGSGGYIYNWSNTDTTNSINGLCTGTYYVTVTDVFGCSSQANGVVTDKQVLTTRSDKTDANCAGCFNGTASITATGGTAPYTYNWDDGETTKSITGLGAGLYRVCVSDANSCVTCDSVLINEVTGVEQLSSQTQMMVYPNPGNGLFTIVMNGSNGTAKAELFTITGERVYEEDFAVNNPHVFNFTQLSKTIYLLQITSNNGINRIKIVFQ